ncbi:sacsin-like, partial [Cherax quadricarinatus]
ELVQNAEDAGATLVEVLHDTRKVQCPRAHNAVQKFLKGPALCLYNNATFTTDDWEGIRKLSDSIKKDDPLKVGQFGLGFKSVFHITDAVTIISGDKVLFMDPSEPENKMCRIVSLKKLTNICPLEDCLLFWSNYMSTQNINDGHFAATLFWFPLRESPSKISDTVYSHSHVTRLFQSFGVEAPVCLTFLNSLEKICLKRINENHNNIEIIHEVELISPCMTEVQQKRRDFKQKLLKCNGIPSQTTTCYYEATIQSVKGNSTEEQIMHILHYLPGSSEASSVVWKGKDSSGHMPLVGVAAPSVKHGSSWSSGHIFCFLPLPLESSNSTNLPVHINGFFALDENRRHVKWKTEESNNEPEVCIRFVLLWVNVGLRDITS